MPGSIRYLIQSLEIPGSDRAHKLEVLNQVQDKVPTFLFCHSEFMPGSIRYLIQSLEIQGKACP